MFNNINILKYIKNASYKYVNEDHVIYSPKTFKENFGCLSLYICSNVESNPIKSINNELEDRIPDYPIKKEENNILVINVNFNDYKEYSDFRNKFEEYYISSKKSFLFWLNVKTEFNNELAKLKSLEINKLAEEVDQINNYINNKK